MTTPPPDPGGEVTTGKLYRLIRPTVDCWEGNRPSPRAFRKDGDSNGISMVIASDRVFEKARREFPDYAIAEIEVARLLGEVPPPDPRTVINPKKRRSEQGVSVKKDYDKEIWGADHVLVIGISDRLRPWIRSIATVIFRPDVPLRPAIP